SGQKAYRRPYDPVMQGRSTTCRSALVAPSTMPQMPAAPRYDIDFAVPFRHRLRFTNDVFGSDLGVLLELLEPLEGPVRVMTVLDEGLVEATAGLAERIDEALRSDPRIRPAGPAVRVTGGEASKQGSQTVARLLELFNDADLDRR